MFIFSNQVIIKFPANVTILIQPENCKLISLLFLNIKSANHFRVEAFVQEGQEGRDPHLHWVEADLNPLRVFLQSSKLREVQVMNVSSPLHPRLHFLQEFLQHVRRTPAGTVDLGLPALPLRQHLQTVLQTEKESFQAEEAQGSVLLFPQLKNQERKAAVFLSCIAPQLEKTRQNFKVFPRNLPAESGKFISKQQTKDLAIRHYKDTYNQKMGEILCWPWHI